MTPNIKEKKQSTDVGINWQTRNEQTYKQQATAAKNGFLIRGNGSEALLVRRTWNVCLKNRRRKGEKPSKP